MDGAQIRYCLVVIVVLMGVGAAVSNRKTHSEAKNPTAVEVQRLDAAQSTPRDAVIPMERSSATSRAEAPSAREERPSASRLSGGIDSVGAASAESSWDETPYGVDASLVAISEEAAPRRHRIADGDSLASLAQFYYGNRAYAAAIYQANADVLKADGLLPIGKMIRIPPRPQFVAVRPEAPGSGNSAARAPTPASMAPAAPIFHEEQASTTDALSTAHRAEQLAAAPSTWERPQSRLRPLVP